MTFSHFTRRLHLYLGTALLPWFLMYGISSIPFAHNSWFDRSEGAEWTVRFDRPYSIETPKQDDLHAFASAVLRDQNAGGAFEVSRQKDAIRILRFDFRNATRFTYFPEQKRLLAEDRGFRLGTFLTGMHARGGFAGPGPLHLAWGVLVDVVSVGFVIWILTGFYMWWGLPSLRKWGYLAIAGGAIVFSLFMMTL
jgi:hypothetical protein